MSTLTLEIRGLDVWGNAEDGYEVNDVYGVQATIEIDSECSEAELIQALIDQDVLHPGKYSFDSFSYEENEFYGNVVDPETDRPILEIRTKGENK